MRQKLKLDTGILLRMNIPERYWDVRFKYVQPGIKKKITPYLRDICKNVSKGEGFIFFGNNGRGKTATAVLLAMEARRNFFSVYFVQSEELRENILNKEMFDDTYSILDRVKEVDFLVIDDFGKEHPDNSGWSSRLFENIFRTRIANRRTTIITTNLIMKDLAKEYSTSMIEVMKDALYPIAFVGDNLRDSKDSQMFLST